MKTAFYEIFKNAFLGFVNNELNKKTGTSWPLIKKPVRFISKKSMI